MRATTSTRSLLRAAGFVLFLAACDDGSSATTSTFTTGNSSSASGTGGSTSSSTTTSSASGTGGAGGACLGPNDCYDCAPKTEPQFLNHCTDASCAPFDNAARLPLYNGGNLPAIP